MTIIANSYNFLARLELELEGPELYDKRFDSFRSYVAKVKKICGYVVREYINLSLLIPPYHMKV